VTFADWDATELNLLVAFVIVAGTVLALTEVLTRINSESKREARRAEENRQLLEVTLASIGDAVIATDAAGRVTFMNGVAEGLTGWNRGEARGARVQSVFHIVNESTREVVEDPCEKVLRTGAIVGLANHTILMSKNGSERPIDDSAAPILDSAGKVLGTVLVFRDATQQRQAEQALQTLATIVEHSDDAIISKTMAGTISSWNLAAEKLYGHRAEEVIGQPISVIIPPNHRDELVDIMRRLKSGEHIEHWDTVRMRKDGSLINVSVQISPIKNSDGEVIGASKVARDITDRKRTEESLAFLAEASQELAALTDRASALEQVARPSVPFFADWCIVHVMNEQGVIEPVSHVHRSADKEQTLGELHRSHPLDWNSASAIARAMRSGAAQLTAEVSAAMLTEQIRNEQAYQMVKILDPRSAISVPLKIRERTMGVMTFVISDTRRQYGPRELEFAEDLARRAATAIDNAQLYQSVQEAVRQRDEFLAMLAHELRSPLAAISYATTLGQMTPAAERTELFEIVERQVGNLTRLIDDLLDVARISRDKIALKREIIDAATIANRAAATVRSLMEQKRHEFQVEIVERAMPILVDPTRAEQILANLLTNAAKYTATGGRVTLRVDVDGRDVVFRVRDTGVGLSPEILTGVFELFAQADHTLDRSEGGLGYEVAERLRAQNFAGTLVAVSGYGQPEDRSRSQASGFDAHLVKPVDQQALLAILHRIRPDGC
jgi:PAS domain S-box-containing protein